MKSEPSPLSELRAAGSPSWRPVLLRAGVTLGVLALLLWWLPLDPLLSAIASLPGWLWFAALAGFAAGHVVSALKWRMLVQASGVRPGVVESLRAHGAGLFANLCLPSIVGGDVLRAGLVIRRHGNAEAVALASLADRILDTLGLLAIAAVGAALVPADLGERTRTALLVLSVLLTAGVLGALVALALLPRVPSHRIPGKLAPILGRVAEAASAIFSRPGVALACLGISMAVQTSFVGLNAALGSAIGLGLPFAVWLLCWPLAKLVALAPVSLGGIGVREAALASLLLPFAVPPALAVAQSLVWESLLVALGLLAGITSFWLGRGAAAGPQTAAEGHA
jgi:uncharacterized membrane protein YbhN (UPF0104 family)